MTTLLLTNRLKNAWNNIEWTDRFILVFYILLFSLIGIILSEVGCNNSKDIPDVAYKARVMFPLIIKDDTVYYNGTEHGYNPAQTYDFRTGKTITYIDTAKPKPKVILNHYKLEGSDTLFQMLWLQVQSPIDVTPRNLQLLKNWLQSSIKIDSSGKQ